MSVAALNSGQHILDTSSKMANEATLQINQQPSLNSLPSPNKEHSFNFNQTEFKIPTTKEIEPDKINALTKLNSAEQYNKIGTNIIQREQKMIGTLLDVHI